MLKPSRRLWPLAAGVVAFLLLLAYAAWLGLSARSALTAARADAEDLTAALREKDDTAADEALARLADHAATARSRTDNPVWSGLGVLPVVGDDAKAVKAASTFVDAAASALGPLLDDETLGADRFAPRDGRIDVDAVAGLAAPLERASARVAAARAAVDAVDPESLLGSFEGDWRDFAEQAGEAADGLDAAARAGKVLPVLLGRGGSAKDLIVFQTPAEPRATGGMPGSIALLTATDGALELEQQQSAAGFGVLDEPVLPLSKAEEVLFGDNLGADVRDAAFTPHFPRAAELIAARWQREHGDRVDGVIAIDPVALGYLLEATGPIKAPLPDGSTVTLTERNLADYLMHQVYVEIDDPAMQDAWFSAVSGLVFDRIRTGRPDASTLISALSRGVRERRIFVHATDAALQERLTGTRVAGELSKTTSGPVQVAAVLNDATGSKMGWFLDYDVTVTSSCTEKGREMLGTMTLRSTLKKGVELPAYITGNGAHGVEAGQHVVSVELYGPQGGTLGGVTFDEQRQPNARLTDYRDHPATQVYVQLGPGETHTVTWSMSVRRHEAVDVRVGAGVEAEDESSHLRAC